MRQVRYTMDDIERGLRNYFRLIEVGRMAPQEDNLGTWEPPKEEAPTSASARVKADLEHAMLRVAEEIGFEAVMIAFFDVALGETSWRHSVRPQKLESGLLAESWRQKVAALWGERTPGRVRDIRQVVVRRMAEVLNG